MSVRKFYALGSSVCLVVSTLSSPLFAQAQDAILADEESLLFQDIPSVYSASKYDQKLTEAPSWVSIITAREIQQYGYRNMADILNSLPGFYLNDDRNYTYLGVRGFGIPGDYNSRVLMLIDGHRINDNIYDSVDINSGSMLDVDLIERVEVVRGPSSSLYGTSAFFVVVNVITKKGRDFNGAEVSVSAGDLNTYSTRLSFGERLENGAEILLSGSYYTSDGQSSLYYPEYDDPVTNNGIAENMDDGQAHSLFAKYAIGDWTITAALNERDKTIPTGAFATEFNDPRSFTEDSHDYIDVKYLMNTEQVGDFTGRLFFDRYIYYGDYVLNYGDSVTPDIVVNTDETYGYWWGGDGQWVKVLNNHKLIAGMEYQKNTRQDQSNYDIYGVYLNDHRNSQRWGIYVQDELSLSQQWAVNLGVRHDQFDNDDSSTNPRLAVLYHPSDTSTAKLIYGTAFRAPNMYELYYNDSGTWLPSLNLEPETIKTLEFVFEQTLNSSLRWVVSAYHNQFDDLIALKTDSGPDTIPGNADDFLIFDNLHQATTNGVDIEINKQFKNDLKAAFSLSSQRTENDSTGDVLVNSPQTMAKLNLRQPLLDDRLTAALELQYQGGRKTIAASETDSFVLANITLSLYEWTKGLTVSASIYNLLDEVYAYPGSEEHLQDAIEQDGRLYRMKLDYRF